MRSVGRCLMVVGSLLLIFQASVGVCQGVPSIWYEDLGTARRVAMETNRLLLVHFWAEWCRPCRQMESEVFSRPDVLSALATNYVAVKVNYDRAPNLVRDFRIESIPADVILTPNGEVLQKFVGGSSPERYIDRINQVAYSYQQRRTMLARTTNPPVAPSASGYAGAPFASMSQTPSPVPAAPSYQPPAVAMNSGSTPAPFGLPEATPNYQGAYSNPQAPTAPPPGPLPYNQLAISPPVSAPPQNQVVTPPPAVSDPSWGYGTSPATAPESPALIAGSPLQAPQNQSQAPGGSSPSFQPPAENPGTYVKPWDSPAVADSRSAAPSMLGMTPSSPASSVASSTPGRPTSKPKVEIPPGNPPLALEGYCPVSLTDKQRWVLGNPRWGARHEGRTYLFAGPEEQQKFLANPDRYAPVLSGLDVVQLVEATQMTDGRREFGAWFGGRVYLFSSEESYQKFSADPYRYINGLPQAVARLSQQVQGDASLASPPRNVAASNPAGQAPMGANMAPVGSAPGEPAVSSPVMPPENVPPSPPVDAVGKTQATTSAAWTPPPTVNIQLPPSVQAVANGTAAPEQSRWPMAQRPRW